MKKFEILIFKFQNYQEPLFNFKYFTHSTKHRPPCKMVLPNTRRLFFMFRKKTKLKLTDFECNLLWGGMNEFRNKACSDGIPTEDVDELLIKIINKSER